MNFLYYSTSSTFSTSTAFQEERESLKTNRKRLDIRIHELEAENSKKVTEKNHCFTFKNVSIHFK